jgi:5-methylcytosine-specific restriction endonuclease McrA
MVAYRERDAAFQANHLDWSQRRDRETIRAGSWGIWETMTVAGAFTFLGCLVFPVIGGFFGFLVGLYVRQYFWDKEQAKLYVTFLTKNPEPANPNLQRPIPPRTVTVNFDLDRTDFASELAATSYRQRILERDDYTCQRCGKRKRESDLEVHHIHTQADGGPRHPKNLIVLCLHCHDREKWFGHVRKFPTTIKRRRKRTRENDITLLRMQHDGEIERSAAGDAR